MNKLFTIFAALLVACCSAQTCKWVSPPKEFGDWKVSFQDGFGGNGVNEQKWNILDGAEWDVRPKQNGLRNNHFYRRSQLSLVNNLDGTGAKGLLIKNRRVWNG